MLFMMLVLADTTPDAEPDDSDVELWVDALDATGQRVVGDILDPSEAKDLRVRAGEHHVTDGPSEATAELWGFDILECTDFDEALELAARHPMARNGRLELRPFPQE